MERLEFFAVETTYGKQIFTEVSKYVWYQYNISMSYHRLVGPFQCWETVITE